ncbi:MAG: RNA-binding cell elongation regulator Jag/EloR [Solirubrobacterales bacterium]
MQVVEKRGKNVDEAIKLALEELGVGPDEVTVEVVEEPSKGLLGIGKKLALVKVTVIARPDRMAKKKLEDLLNAMKIDYTIDRVDYEPGMVRINIIGKDMGLLIGRKGETLNAIQFLVGLMVNRESEEKVRVMLDVEDYRLKREESLKDLAMRLSDKVKRTRRSVVMRPMGPQERRIVHTALQNDPQIVTFSQGDEPNRKVVISLKK